MEEQTTSLLERISSRQINDLIFEHKLAIDGYKFYYTLDNHDVLKYCFPGGVEGNDFEKIKDKGGERINYELVTDIITAYEDFFSKIDKNNPVFFLDEYIPELIELRNRLLLQLVPNGPKVYNYAEDFNNLLNRSSEKSFVSDVTMFIATATGLLKETTARYNSLMSNNYFVIRDEDNPDIPEILLLRKFFNDAHKAKEQLADNIFDIFMSLPFRHRRSSTRIDSEAFARVIHINNSLLTHQKSKKIHFLFLSTTPKSKEVVGFLEMFYPIIENQAFNPHRSVEQLFFKMLIQDLDSDTKLERLKTWGAFIQFREENFLLGKIENDKRYKELEKKAIESFKELREKYVSINFSRRDRFKEISRIYEHLSKFEKGRNIGRLKLLYRELKDNSALYKDDKANIEEIKKVESTFGIEQLFGIALKKSLADLMAGHPIVIKRGDDYITGTGQHMPIVFSYKGHPQGEILKEIAELYIDQFAFLSTTASKNEIIQKLTELINDVYATGNAEKTCQENLIFGLCLLILPESGTLNNQSNNKHIESFLWKLYERGDFEKEDKNLFSDFLYTLAWVLRRNNEYSKALEVTKKGLKNFPKDARFYHSRFLINVCHVSNKARPTEADLTTLLKDIKFAQRFYPLLLDDQIDTIRNNVNATLLNSEIYTDTLLVCISEITRDEKLRKLTQIRGKKLNTLKHELELNYQAYPEFQHTEAFLELQESLNEDDKEKKLLKLNCAIKTLDNGIVEAKKLQGFRLSHFENLLKILGNKKEKLLSSL